MVRLSWNPSSLRNECKLLLFRHQCEENDCHTLCIFIIKYLQISSVQHWKVQFKFLKTKKNNFQKEFYDTAFKKFSVNNTGYSALQKSTSDRKTSWFHSIKINAATFFTCFLSWRSSVLPPLASHHHQYLGNIFCTVNIKKTFLEKLN